MSNLDKIMKIKNSMPAAKNAASNSYSDIWHQFKEGDNNIRLVGEFIQVKQHYIAPNPKKKMRGLCIPDAFSGENKLLSNINCADWDIDTESERKEKRCVICRLNQIAKTQLKNKSALSKEENEFFFALMSETNPRNQLRWNILDRDNPYITEVVDGQKKKVLGYKVASIGMEAWKDISGIFDQLGIDIADVNDGIDLVITRLSVPRVNYTAKAAMNKMSVKQTPLTPEERALKLHDLRKMCGKQADQSKVLESLHLDLRSYLDEVQEEQAKGNAKVSQSSSMANIKERLGAMSQPKPTVTIPSKPVASKPKEEVPPFMSNSDEPMDIANVQLDEEADFSAFETEESTQ